MNEHNIEIDLYQCRFYKNLESFLVYFDQTNDIDKCFVYSSLFDIPSLSEYFISHGANINEKDEDGITDLHYSAFNNRKETVEHLLSHGANVNEGKKYMDIRLFILQQFIIIKKQLNFFFYMLQMNGV